MTARAPFAALRMDQILQRLDLDGRVDVAVLAQQLGVSNESVRKDLIQLEAQGSLRRVHGGAIPVRHRTAEIDVAARTVQMKQKRAIARAALAHVPAGGSILIDAGSTTTQLAELIGPDPELIVYTNTLPIALRLLPRVTVLTLGGRIRRPTAAEVGPAAARALAEINVDVAFLGTNGFSFHRGLTSPDPDEAATKRLMLAAAQRRIFLVDHTKFGLESLCQHAELTDIDLLITDSGVTGRDRSALAAHQIDVEIAQ